ncbi:hypothetical protein [Halomonas elongata]|uniref:hypothetical protein n=1 Tax=Halomonas elongata TaxID=2746 RepID=UPI004034EB16
MSDLLTIASRIDAAARFLQCVQPELDPEHRAVLEMCVRGLGLYAVEPRRGHHCWMSQALRDDLAGIVPYEDMDGLLPDDLLDMYVTCRLFSAVSSVRLIESTYLEDSSSSPRIELGKAMFECLEWIESATRQLVRTITIQPMGHAA